MSSSISIIIPNFNKASFLRETLDSIIEQTSDNWEAIIVDDGSTDGSKELFDDYRRIDERIQVYCLERGNGGSFCRNYGLSNAKYEYVIFLDADDLLEPFCVEHRLSVYKEHPTLDFIVFSMGTFKVTKGDSGSVWLPKVDQPLQKFLRHELPWQTMQPIWKKEFALKLNGFNSEYQRMQDVEFHTRALINSDNYLLLNQKADCWFRISDERLTLSHYSLLNRFMKSANKYFLEFKKLGYEHELKFMLLEVCALGISRKNMNFISNKELKNLLQESNILELLQTNGFWPLRFYLFIASYIPIHIVGLKRVIRLLLT